MAAAQQGQLTTFNRSESNSVDPWPTGRARNLDIPCAVLDWDTEAPTPKLTLLCPPSEVFAPLRVHLKLSWDKSEHVPEDCSQILAPPKTHTKVRADRGALFVWLKIQGKEKSKARWVVFNHIVGIALQPESGAK